MATAKELLEACPKNFPRWNDKYPCPKEVTQYLSSIAMLKINKNFPIPPTPDWGKIFKEHHEANT